MGRIPNLQLNLTKKLKMKKLLITLIVVCFATASIFAQMGRQKNKSNFQLGILGGLNIPNLTGGNGNPLSSGWSSRTGEAFGMTVTLNLGSNFAMQADALYSSEGGKRDGMQAIDGSSINPQVPQGTYFYANFHNRSVLNYAEMPVMLKYNLPIGKSSVFYADFGPYAGFLLNARQKTSGSSIVYADATGGQPVSVNPATGQPVAVSFDANTDITNSIKNINVGLTGGIGYSQWVAFGDISLDLRGAYGLTTIQKDTKNGSSHTGNLLFALGYSIPL